MVLPFFICRNGPNATIQESKRQGTERGSLGRGPQEGSGLEGPAKDPGGPGSPRRGSRATGLPPPGSSGTTHRKRTCEILGPGLNEGGWAAGARGASCTAHAAYLHRPPVPRAVPVTEGDFDLLTWEAELALGLRQLPGARGAALKPRGSSRAGSPSPTRSAGLTLDLLLLGLPLLPQLFPEPVLLFLGRTRVKEGSPRPLGGPRQGAGGFYLAVSVR